MPFYYVTINALLIKQYVRYKDDDDEIGEIIFLLRKKVHLFFVLSVRLSMLYHSSFYHCVCPPLFTMRI